MPRLKVYKLKESGDKILTFITLQSNRFVFICNIVQPQVISGVFFLLSSTLFDNNVNCPPNVIGLIAIFQIDKRIGIRVLHRFIQL
jgi:hypothetical protein